MDRISKISCNAFLDERASIEQMLNQIVLGDAALESIHQEATKYSEIIQKTKNHGVESFVQEYSLNTEEGVAVMCLAEALLRIPDDKTAKELVEDKMHGKNWSQHLGKSDSVFVNASSWGLFLTGKIVDFSASQLSFAKLVGKLGEPVLLAAIKKAIQFLSSEFIMGEDIEKGRKRAVEFEKNGYRVSYDILGESSRNQAQADFYYQEYLKAVGEIAKSMVQGRSIYQQPSISIKLSALHPRFELLQIQRVEFELLPRVLEIVNLCAKHGIAVSFDAEEASRLDIYLYVMTKLLSHSNFRDYQGIGFVIQAYQKRAAFVIDYVVELAQKFAKKIPVRLVKGAYWDSEVKSAQEQGLESYPVYTTKEFTDVSYLFCVQKMFANTDWIYPQFATHNAYTVAAVKYMSQGADFEFQKLHGMGEVLHHNLVKDGNTTRIYAPVGHYRDLLAYLMRRLLENGANTSFIHMIKEKDMVLSGVLTSPMLASAEKISSNKGKFIEPLDIFNGARQSSIGYDLGILHDVQVIKEGVSAYQGKRYEVASIIDGVDFKNAEDQLKILKPGSFDVLGTADKSTSVALARAMDVANSAFASWCKVDVITRAAALEKFGELLHEQRYHFYSLLIKEAGKTIRDSIAEVREAIDFARYYACKAREMMAAPLQMPGYTGENNTLSLHGRGVFICISPWNFPLAIFAGQVLAALVAGNTVIAKPAAFTSIIAYEIVKLIYQAGIPTNALQMVICDGAELGNTLIKDERTAGVCFTGSTAVARAMNRNLAARNCAIAPLIAETGGQNCMIVDSSALLEQVTDSVIQSAFGSMGQRCSALRVLYIQREIYEPLLEMIIGAMNELKIGNTENFENDLGPLISASSRTQLTNHVSKMRARGFNIRAVHKADSELAEMKGYYFAPHILEINHISEIREENFGPILHVRSYESVELDSIIDEIHSTTYGLTFGIHSRIENKVRGIAEKVKAGNIYVNRSTIGAQVESHPFGGEGNSGTGFKAGGPHYLLKFIVERTLTINTTAIGGNVQLLSEKADH